MTTCHTSREMSLSLLRLCPFSLFVLFHVAHRGRVTLARYTPCAPPFMCSLLSTVADLSHPFYFFTLRSSRRRFLLRLFRRDMQLRPPRRGFARDAEKRKSRSLLELRSEAVVLKRAWFIYFPEFSRNALQSRMKRYAEIGALCRASCHSFGKKKKSRGKRTPRVARSSRARARARAFYANM